VERWKLAAFTFHPGGKYSLSDITIDCAATSAPARSSGDDE